MGVDGFMAKVLQFCGWQLERVSGVPSLELDFKVTRPRALPPLCFSFLEQLWRVFSRIFGLFLTSNTGQYTFRTSPC